MDGAGVKDGGAPEQAARAGRGGRGGVLRWLAWFVACIAAGVALGLLMPSGAAPTQAPERAAPAGLRAQASPLPGYTARASRRLGGEARRAGPRPRIAVVIDDLGLDRAAFERVNRLPGPLTLSFLPYGTNAQAMLDDVRPVHEAMLHLPAEPLARTQDAGPDMLRVGPRAEIEAALDANLAKLSGYAGLNNHTGSRFTGDEDAMRALLAALDARGLYFLDSLTTPTPVARRLGAAEGWRVAARDVFLDDDYAGGEAAVRAQLEAAERIARATGEAVVIGHPYRATVAALGPWLVTAQARGFELVTVGALAEVQPPPVMAELR